MFAGGIIFLYGPTVLAAGVFIVLGFWGKPRWSSPYCIKCRYDLRGRVPSETQACPECGTALQGPKAVGFLRYGRRWSLLVLGAFLILWPFLLAGGVFAAQHLFAGMAQPSPSNMGQQATATVLGYAATNTDKPWGWKELERRLRGGDLSQAEIDQAIDALIAFMLATAPQGYDKPLHWADRFLKPAYGSGAIDDGRVVSFLDAFHGTAPRLNGTLRRARPGENLHVQLRCASTWQHSVGIPVRRLFHLKSVRIGGEPVEITNRSASDDELRGSIRVDAERGQRQIEFIVDFAYVPKADLVGLNARRATPDDWPEGIKRWTATLKSNLTVLGPDDRPVTPVSDATLRPVARKHIKVKDCLTRTEAGKLKLIITLEADNTAVPLSFDASARIDGKEHPMGSMTFLLSGNSRTYSGMEQSVFLAELDTSVRALDVVLEPNPRHWYSDSRVDQCWGERVVLEGVPIRRLDLDAGLR